MTNAVNHSSSTSLPESIPVDPEKSLKELFEKYKDKFDTSLSFERFKELLQSPEYIQIKQMKQNILDNKLTCKIIQGQLERVFGEANLGKLFERTLNKTDEEILENIVKQDYFFSCDKTVVEAFDHLRNPIKFENGICITPQYVHIMPVSNKFTIHPDGVCRIYSDGNGRYLRVEDCNKILEYINPKEISSETPRMTSAFLGNDFYRLVENGETNTLIIKTDKFKDGEMMCFEYNPETKQVYKAYIKGDTEKIPITDKSKLSELAEIFDFAKLSERDYISTIKGMISEIIK